MLPNDEDLLRTPEAARELKLGPATLAKWRVRGIGPPYHKLGHLVLYRVGDLKAWVKAQRREPQNAQ